MHPLNNTLTGLAKFCAILAGVLLTVITLMTCVSLIGRNTTGWTIAGDFELTGVVAGAAIALFLPWCQVKRGNIIVDFFTTNASSQTQDKLDRFGALVVGIIRVTSNSSMQICLIYTFSVGNKPHSWNFLDSSNVWVSP
ncbi:MAG TPA: TRAP transporter small permease subunit, partial [Burkholderiaceae bacterium]|nr:TRAP transporter small permease subunit [Burkholderiaceae bacterium]